MKNIIFYTIAGTIVGVVAQLAGLGMGAVFGLSLIVPPVLLIAWIIFKSRGIERQAREAYWARPRKWD